MGKVRMSLTVDEELWKKLGHLAVERNISKNDLIIELIGQGLKKSTSIKLLGQTEKKQS